MAEDTCPGCDGTVDRAVLQGREITTWERCERCQKRESALWAKYGGVIIAPTNRAKFGDPSE